MNENNSDFDSDVWFTVEQLAKLGLPGYPRTGRRWHNRAKAEGWKSRTVASQGRTGQRTEYSPPSEVRTIIESRLRRLSELASMSKHEAGMQGCLAEKLANEFEQKHSNTAADLATYSSRESLHPHHRVAEPQAHYHSRDPAILRMAITLAEEASTVQKLSIDQRVELIMSFYQRLSKKADSKQEEFPRLESGKDCFF